MTNEIPPPTQHPHRHLPNSQANHHHHHHLPGENTKNIGFAFGINLFFTIVEILGAYWSGSVAIWADALHDLGDSASLAVSWYFEHVAQKRPTKKFTYGLRRMSLLGAMFSGGVIVTGSVIIVYQSLLQLLNPEGSIALRPSGMIALAIFGVVANSIAAWRLSKGSNQNTKVLSWHLIEDVLGWAAVLIGAIIIYFTHWNWLDPILAIAITVYISFNVIQLSLDTLNLFLQGSPIGFDQEELVDALNKIENVINIHEVHAWSLDGSTNILSLHVTIDLNASIERVGMIKEQIRHIISHYGNFHTTIEVEHDNGICMDSCM